MKYDMCQQFRVGVPSLPCLSPLAAAAERMPTTQREEPESKSDHTGQRSPSSHIFSTSARWTLM